MRYNMSYTREQALARPAPTKPTKLTKGRPAPGEPLDPNELSQRLYAVLAEQKAQAEKRRKTKVEAGERKVKDAQSGTSHGKVSSAKGSSSVVSHSEPSGLPIASEASELKILTKPQLPKVIDGSASSKRLKPARLPSQRESSKTDLAATVAKPVTEESGPHPYVPREAAAQFARTTTPAIMREGKLSYRLSKQALKSHLEDAPPDPVIVALNSAMTPLARQRSLRKAQSQRDRLQDRPQFRHSRILEEACETEEERDVSNHRHTFEGSFSGNKKPEQQHNARRSSTGDLVEKHDQDEGPVLSTVVLDPANVEEEEMDVEVIDSRTAEEHRVDWTQSDERKDKTSHILKPKLSIWTLRGRLGSLTKHSREDKGGPPDHAEAVIQPMSPKSPKAGFFSRFKH